MEDMKKKSWILWGIGTLMVFLPPLFYMGMGGTGSNDVIDITSFFGCWILGIGLGIAIMCGKKNE